MYPDMDRIVRHISRYVSYRGNAVSLHPYSVVCSVTTVIFIDFCMKKLNVFSQHEKQMNIWIPQNKSPWIEILINFLCLLLPEILFNDAAST